MTGERNPIDLPKSPYPKRAAVLLCLAAAMAAGCGEEIAGGAKVDAPFTMFGVLSPDLDTQAVRIYVPERMPTLGSPDVDADVFSIDLQTGGRRKWIDSTVVDPNGQHEHVFWAPFRAEFGRTYRVEAVRHSDGATSFAEVRIPPRVSVRINEANAPILDVLVEGEHIRGSQAVAVYVIGDDEIWSRYNISYAGSEVPIDTGWSVSFNMIVDYNFIRFQIGSGGGYCRDYVPLLGLRLRMLVGDAAWSPPGQTFDPNVLSFPRTMSNVENGYGFVGGGYFLDVPLSPSRETVEAACFTYAFPNDE